MANFQTVIFILAILIGLSAITDKIKLPYPILLVGTGLVIGFVPFLPNLALDPDVALIIFLPPCSTMRPPKRPGRNLPGPFGPSPP